MTDVLLTEERDRVALLTLNRPASRNALSTELVRTLAEAMRSAEENDDVDVIVLTGADPAFCAGVDLKELGASGRVLRASPESDGSPWPRLTKPLIGAINGVAVTGGLEIALQCDFLIASDRARFADTHTRVGVLPGWGLTVLLPQAVGVRRAIEMSMTGNYMDAAEALQFGLVNRVVPHDDLIPTALALAADIISNDQAGVRALLSSYKRAAATTGDEGYKIERETAREFTKSRGGFDPAEVEARRAGILQRGRAQTAN